MELQFTARLFDELEALYPDSNAAGAQRIIASPERTAQPRAYISS